MISLNTLTLGRSFWLFRAGQFISILGNISSGIALSWWVLEKTGSAKELAFIFVPVMILQLTVLPIFGVLGDCWKKKNLIIISEVANGLLYTPLVFLAWSNNCNISVIVVTFLLSAIAKALFRSNSMSYVVELVPKEKVPIALSMSSSTSSFATIIGGVLGGLMISAFGIKWVFALNILSYTVAAILTLFTNPLREAEKITESTTIKKISFTEELKNGVIYVLSKKSLVLLLPVFFIINVIASPIQLFIPLIAKSLSNKPIFLGLLESGLGAGAIIGSFVFILFSKKVALREILITGTSIFGIILITLPYLPLALVPTIGMVALGIAIIVVGTAFESLINLLIEDKYRARVNSLLSLLLGLAAPIGISLTAIISDEIGINACLVVCGSILAIICPLMLAQKKYRSFFDLKAAN